MMLADLASAVRKSGCQVVEVPGWAGRGDGVMAGVRTITCHDTAGPTTGDYPSLQVVKVGRPDLRGPLAQLFLSRAGVVYVVAAGKCNHAGASLRASETNEWAIGIEAEAHGIAGTVSDWPAVQMTAYARLCAALVDHYDLSVADVRGHKETCSPPGRKVDPDFDMDEFRSRVAAVNLTQKDTDMATTAELRALIVDVLKTEKIVPNRPTAADLAKDPNAPTTYFTVASVLANIETDDDNRSASTAGRLTAIEGALLQLVAGVDKLTAPKPQG